VIEGELLEFGVWRRVTDKAANKTEKATATQFREVCLCVCVVLCGVATLSINSQHSLPKFFTFLLFSCLVLFSFV